MGRVGTTGLLGLRRYWLIGTLPIRYRKLLKLASQQYFDSHYEVLLRVVLLRSKL